MGEERVLPLSITASKTLVSHCEPAAGIAGLAFASSALSHSSPSPISHLTSLNPHLKTHLENGRGLFHMSRQSFGKPNAAASDESQMSDIGISSFAFQGTQ